MSTAPPSHATVSERLSKLHQAFTLDELYLGSPLVRNDVEWKTIGNGKLVVEVIKDPASSQDTATKSDASSVTTPSHPSLGNDVEQEPAVLVFIARVSTQNYFFAADGCFRNAVPKMETVKPSCLLEMLEFPIFRDDFTTVVDNITHLENLVATQGYEKQSVVKTEQGVTRIRLRHTLFVVCFFAKFQTNAQTDS